LKIEEEESISGDKCHRDLLNVPNGVAGRFFAKHFKPPNIYMCCDDKEVELTPKQYEDLLNNLC
jgi:hypothetical protein